MWTQCLRVNSKTLQVNTAIRAFGYISVESYRYLSTHAKTSLKSTQRITVPSCKSHTNATEYITVNGSKYVLPPPGRPVVGICMDGTSQEYIKAAIDAGVMPNWRAIVGDASDTDVPFRSLAERDAFALGRGTHALVTSAYPTFTNPNNVSIMTGVLPAEHGISGNYYVDDEGKEVLMTSPSSIRSHSIFAALADAGVQVTLITVKDKLKRLLSHELQNHLDGGDRARCFSIESLSEMNPQQLAEVFATPQFTKAFSVNAGQAAIQDASGVAADLAESQRAPKPYHPCASAYGIRLGASLACAAAQRSDQRSLFYITTTDYIQHVHAPGAKAANALMHELDRAIGALHRAGVVVGVTADHGMNDKCRYNGEPRVVYLSDELQKRCGLVDGESVRVILPITDPYIAHHAALGGCAYVKFIRKRGELAAGMQVDTIDESMTQRIMHELRQIPGIYTVVGARDAARAFDLPIDRIGDFVVLGDQHTAIGSAESFHAPQLEAAMSQRGGTDATSFRLRSHGALDEGTVPLFINRALTSEMARRLSTGKGRNFDLYSILLSGIHPESLPAKI